MATASLRTMKASLLLLLFSVGCSSVSGKLQANPPIEVWYQVVPEHDMVNETLRKISSAGEVQHRQYEHRPQDLAKTATVVCCFSETFGNNGESPQINFPMYLHLQHNFTQHQLQQPHQQYQLQQQSQPHHQQQPKSYHQQQQKAHTQKQPQPHYQHQPQHNSQPHHQQPQSHYNQQPHQPQPHHQQQQQQQQQQKAHSQQDPQPHYQHQPQHNPQPHQQQQSQPHYNQQLQHQPQHHQQPQPHYNQQQQHQPQHNPQQPQPHHQQKPQPHYNQEQQHQSQSHYNQQPQHQPQPHNQQQSQQQNQQQHNTQQALLNKKVPAAKIVHDVIFAIIDHKAKYVPAKIFSKTINQSRQDKDHLNEKQTKKHMDHPLHQFLQKFHDRSKNNYGSGSSSSHIRMDCTVL